MSSSQPIDDRLREAQYGRLASNILRVLRDAVDRRVAEGETKTSLASKLGWNRSQLSRLLNGNVGNITIKSISDILWVARFEPDDFEAMAHEDISPNYVEGLAGSTPDVWLGDIIKTQNAPVVASGGNDFSIQLVVSSSVSGHNSKMWVGA